MEAQRRTEIQRLRSMRWRKSLRKKELRPRSFRWAVNRSGAVLPVDSVLKKADVSLTIWSTRRRRNSRNVTGLLWDRRCTMPLQMRRW